MGCCQSELEDRLSLELLKIDYKMGLLTMSRDFDPNTGQLLLKTILEYKASKGILCYPPGAGH
jgi:hypothetical protein